MTYRVLVYAPAARLCSYSIRIIQFGARYADKFPLRTASYFWIQFFWDIEEMIEEISDGKTRKKT